MSFNKPKISVLIAAYNEQEHIGRCLRSLLNQSLSHEKFEIVIVNDGSTDLTSYALKQFSGNEDSNIKVLTNDTNVGLPVSLNRGLNLVCGEYLVRVDSDDYVSEQFLLILSQFLDGNPDSYAVACDYWTVSDEEVFLKRKNCMIDPIACGIMFQTELIRELGGYDERFSMNEEKELRLRFEKKYSIAHLPIPLYRYRKHKNNMTNNKELLAVYDEPLEQGSK